MRSATYSNIFSSSCDELRLLQCTSIQALQSLLFIYLRDTLLRLGNAAILWTESRDVAKKKRVSLSKLVTEEGFQVPGQILTSPDLFNPW